HPSANAGRPEATSGFAHVVPLRGLAVALLVSERLRSTRSRCRDDPSVGHAHSRGRGYLHPRGVPTMMPPGSPPTRSKESARPSVTLVSRVADTTLFPGGGVEGVRPATRGIGEGIRNADHECLRPRPAG